MDVLARGRDIVPALLFAANTFHGKNRYICHAVGPIHFRPAPAPFLFFPVLFVQTPHLPTIEIGQRNKHFYTRSPRPSTTRIASPNINAYYARSEYHTQVAKMSFDQIFNLTAGVYLYIIYMWPKSLENPSPSPPLLLFPPPLPLAQKPHQTSKSANVLNTTTQLISPHYISTAI